MDSRPLSWAALGESLRLAWGGGLWTLTRSAEESQGDQGDGEGELHGGQEAGEGGSGPVSGSSGLMGGVPTGIPSYTLLQWGGQVTGSTYGIALFTWASARWKK